MSERLSIEPGKTAVLIMDYQTDIIGFLGTNQEDLLKRASQVLQGARDVKILVIYVVVGFRPGYPEVSSRNTMFTGPNLSDSVLQKNYPLRYIAESKGDFARSFPIQLKPKG